MSYEKAMKHSRNVRKVKKQATQYMGFDSGFSGSNIRRHPIVGLEITISEWFRDRHKGGNFQYIRECIIEQIKLLRDRRIEFNGKCVISTGC